MRVALLQMTAGLDPRVNGESLVAAIREAKAGGADMLFTPEMSGLLDRDRARAARHLHLEGEDPVLGQVRAAAAEAELWVQLGSLALKGAGAEERLVNRAFLVDGAGRCEPATTSCICSMWTFPPVSWRESAVYAPGQDSVVASTPWGSLGLSICYDLRFPALFAALSSGGARLLSVPAAFTVPTGQAHWHVLLRARAIENACFVIAAAQTGRHEDGRETFGHSLVVDPWGAVLLDMGEAPGLGFADLDLHTVDEVRGRVPVLAHRRPIPAPEPVQ